MFKLTCYFKDDSKSEFQDMTWDEIVDIVDDCTEPERVLYIGIEPMKDSNSKVPALGNCGLVV